MKCSNVKKEIDRLVYLDEPDAGNDIYRHIDSCKSCSRYMEESRQVAGKIAGLRHREPVLNNPERLTEDIMTAIRSSSENMEKQKQGKMRKYRGIIILQRLLAAASVCLFLAFGYEEYTIVDKISRLEKQNAAISLSSRYQAALKLKKVIGILSSDPVMLNYNKELNTRKLNLTSLFRAAIYADVAGMTPDALKLLDRAGYKVANQPVKSIIKEFNSTSQTEPQ